MFLALDPFIFESSSPVVHKCLMSTDHVPGTNRGGHTTPWEREL